VTKIHGISNAKAKKEGHEIKTVLTKFQKHLSEANLLIAHNIRFDEMIVGAEFLRHNMPNQIPKKKKICTMLSSTEYCGLRGYYGYKWPKLSELHYKLFKTEFEDAHNAAQDIQITAKCFWEMKKRKVI
jgi:DNA polymerase III epsilon subunit-like protein